MRRPILVFSALVALLFLASLSFAQTTATVAPNDVAHGSEKVGHEMAHPTEDHGGEHEQPKFLGLPAWIFKLVNMLLFIGILVYLVKGPVGAMFNGRRDAIAAELQQAAERRAKSERLAQDIQSRLQQIEGEVASILQRAREEGERQKAELLAAAEVEAQKILASARNEVDVSLKAARNELTAYARHLSTQRAAELLRSSITEADQKRLFAESVEKMAEVRS